MIQHEQNEFTCNALYPMLQSTDRAKKLETTLKKKSLRGSRGPLTPYLT